MQNLDFDAIPVWDNHPTIRTFRKRGIGSVRVLVYEGGFFPIVFFRLKDICRLIHVAPEEQINVLCTQNLAFVDGDLYVNDYGLGRHILSWCDKYRDPLREWLRFKVIPAVKDGEPASELLY